MTNFTQFKCDTCHRKTEQLINQTHATLTKCTITYKCAGTLIKIGSSDTQTLTTTANYNSTLPNWVPRGTVVPVGSPVPASQPTINSAQDILSIAIPTADATESSLTMVLEIQQVSNNSFTEFLFNRTGPVSLLAGKDDSSKRISLSFSNGSNPDVLVVYVNGVEIDSSLYNRTVANRLTFNPVLSSETSLIQVLVYQQVATSYTSLTFYKNNVENPITPSAWSNVSTFEIPRGTSYTGYTCSNVSGLLINSRLIVTSLIIGDTTLTGVSDTGYFLRANSPFSNYDRDLLDAMPLSTMITSQQVIYYKADSNNSPKFFVDATTPVSLFPPISITELWTPNITTTSMSTVDTQLTNLYIT